MAAAEPAAESLVFPELELVGTLLRRDARGRHDLALISKGGADPRWFIVNEAVTNEATLVEVQPRRVFLRHDGRVLELPFSTRLGALAAMPEDAAIPALPAHADALLTPVPGIALLADNYFKVSRKVLDEHLHSAKSFQDNEAFFLEEGGLFISRLGDESILEKLGLRVGDVLTGVGGKPFDSLLDVPRVNQLIHSKTLTRLDLDVVRHGLPQRLTYELGE